MARQNELVSKNTSVGIPICRSLLILIFSRTILPAMPVDNIRVGQLSGCLNALYSGVTTIVDCFFAANSLVHAQASLETTVRSVVRVIWCPARQGQVTQLFTQCSISATLEDGPGMRHGNPVALQAVEQGVSSVACKLGPHAA